jgi:hypothetical protein
MQGLQAVREWFTPFPPLHGRHALNPGAGE